MLKFNPVQSAVDPGFWYLLASKKLEEYRLSQEAIEIQGGYPTIQHTALNEQGEKVVLPSHFTLSDQAFSKEKGIPGTLINTNTIEDFRQLDKNALFEETTRKIQEWVHSGQAKKDPSGLHRFLLITFADLKKYRFYYWFAFPALVPTQPWELEGQYALTEDENARLEMAYLAWAEQDEFFLIENESFQIESLAAYDSKKSYLFGLKDNLSQPGTLGWQARNFLYMIHQTWNIRQPTLVVYQAKTSVGFRCLLGSGYPTTVKSVGWERNFQGKLGPRMADLGSLMDPKSLSDEAVDLNLKLMKWRLLPRLDLERIKKTRCLLLGAGTLGCYVARCLMGWGVREITFVDNGHVSFSNPVRQPLYQFKDTLSGGSPKAEAAAAHLKEIQPSMTSKGVTLSIPMPGHDHYPDKETLAKELERLEDLVKEHDVIFLLTDSRESRWLPTLLGARHKKLVMNSALGFDSYLVMRHGTPKNGLGCYFCNDIVAPVDSLADRTLDQQCTVTRPGLALMASAQAVELMVSLGQHAEGMNAPADTAKHRQETHLMGLLPHQIRGFLGDFNQILISGQAYDQCTACSTQVLAAYDQDCVGFIKTVLKDPLSLEELTGLKALKEESEALLNDWIDPSDESDF